MAKIIGTSQCEIYKLCLFERKRSIQKQVKCLGAMLYEEQARITV